MAHIRTIKPQFFSSEDIVKLSFPARILYQGLWCEADREGRLHWRPVTFKHRYLPADDVDILSLCRELTDGGLVVLYGDGLAYIPSFKRHQHVNPREAESALPEPTDELVAQAADTIARVTDASVTRILRDSDAQGGREGKGKEGKENLELHTNTGARARDERDDQPAQPEGLVGNEKQKKSKPRQNLTAIPDGFGISERVREWALRHKHSDSDLQRHLDHFVGRAVAKDYRYADWDQAFINAIRSNWAKIVPGLSGSGAGGPPPARAVFRNGDAAARVIAMIRGGGVGNGGGLRSCGAGNIHDGRAVRQADV